MKHVKLSWSLLWRATLFAPAFFAFSLILVVTWFSRFVAPLWIGFEIYLGDWMMAGVGFSVWIASLLLWRNERFRGMLEKPPSLL